MAPPTIRVALTMIGKLALRSRWRNIIPQFDTPIALAASTYCISLSCRKVPRTSRAMLIQLVRARIRIMYLICDPKIAMTRILRKSEGTEFITSTIRMNTVSTHPPK
ncbi:hypothetical protein D3C75_1049180 [compost metagenome]